MPIPSQLLARPRPAEEEQLLRLFWNRAELKKEFTRLRRDKERLTEQLRQQEGTTLRLQQRLEQLEAMLGDGERAAGVVIHYQLCAVWAHGRKRLIRLTQDLSRRQREREQQQQLAAVAEHRRQAVSAIDRRLAELAQRRGGLEADLEHLAERRAQLRGPWNVWRRHQLSRREQVIRESMDSVEAQRQRQQAARAERLAALAEPEVKLSIEGRRRVNLTLIALGQELLLHFRQHDIARLAREAASRRPGEVSYGSSEHCRALGTLIDSAVRQLESRTDLSDRTRARAGELARSVEYRRESDTVPVAASVDRIALDAGPFGSPGSRGGALGVNILTEEYWDIYRVLLA
ncbi:MAG: hypothetical protein JJT85_01450 [Chromatiales bacterium]|nr:hypothetical protein [Chromatiales bacterium]